MRNRWKTGTIVHFCRHVLPWFVFLSLMISSLSVPSPCRATQDQQTGPISDIPTPLQKGNHLCRILERGVLEVALYYKDKPPFVMTDKFGNLYGLDIDLAQMIAKELGVTLQFDRSARSYTELVDKLALGQVDMVLCKLSRTLGRALKIQYSTPYVILHQTLILNKRFMARNRIPNEYPITKLRNMKFRIGVREKTSYAEYADHLFPFAEIIERKWEDLLTMVQHGEIDGLMRDEYTIRRLFSISPDMAIDLSAYVLLDRKDPIAAGLPAESHDLKRWLDLFFEERLPQKKGAHDLIINYPELLESIDFNDN